MELWLAGGHVAGQAAETARRVEDEGFDGLSFGDTQCISADPYVGLTAAAVATSRLKLMVGVTNPVTRHPATTASAIASLQVVSGGRAVLGIGRGDSAVSKLGRRAATVADLDAYVAAVQAYLSGDAVDLDGKHSRLEWLAPLGLPKVPVDVAATGPAVIGVGARRAERLTFNVGADRDRLAASITMARRAYAEAGRAGEPLSLGAFLPVAPHPSAEVARDLVRGVTAVYARFQSMPGHPSAAVRPENAATIDAVAAHYDPSGHGRGDAAHAAVLDADFIDRFAVVGPPEVCVDTLCALADLGLDRLVMVGPHHRSDPTHVAESRRLLSEAVLPEVRRRTAVTGVTA